MFAFRELFLIQSAVKNNFSLTFQKHIFILGFGLVFIGIKSLNKRFVVVIDNNTRNVWLLKCN